MPTPNSTASALGTMTAVSVDSLSRDTWAYNYQNPVELNRYVYTSNNPVRYTEPSGHENFVGWAKQQLQSYSAWRANFSMKAAFIEGAVSGFIGWFLATILFSVISNIEFTQLVVENPLDMAMAIVFGGVLGVINARIDKLFFCRDCISSGAITSLSTALNALGNIAWTGLIFGLTGMLSNAYQSITTAILTQKGDISSIITAAAYGATNTFTVVGSIFNFQLKGNVIFTSAVNTLSNLFSKYVHFGELPPIQRRQKLSEMALFKSFRAEIA